MPCWLTVVCCLQGMPDRMFCAVLEQFQLYFSRWYVCFVSVWVCPLYKCCSIKDYFLFFLVLILYTTLFFLCHTCCHSHSHTCSNLSWRSEDRAWSSRQVSLLRHASWHCRSVLCLLHIRMPAWPSITKVIQWHCCCYLPLPHQSSNRNVSLASNLQVSIFKQTFISKSIYVKKSVTQGFAFLVSVWNTKLKAHQVLYQSSSPFSLVLKKSRSHKGKRIVHAV